MAPPPEDKERLEQHSADVEKIHRAPGRGASGAGSRASVVLTVRADFYNPLIRNPLLAALLPKQQVNIPPMSRDDLRSAIETPAKTAGLSFAPPELVDRILDDVGLEEGRLPLLQFALKETWERREGDKLTAEAYTAVGGVAGAIEKTAEDAYERLTPSQKDAARRLFLRLVTPGEGQADTRARSVIPDDPEQRDIVSLFANPKTRLLVTGYETLQGAARAGSEARSTVEVAHEALIQRWPTLRDWVRANRENCGRGRRSCAPRRNGRSMARTRSSCSIRAFSSSAAAPCSKIPAMSRSTTFATMSSARSRRNSAGSTPSGKLRWRIRSASPMRGSAPRRSPSADLVAALLVAAAAVWQYFDATAAKKEAVAERDRARRQRSVASKARAPSSAGTKPLSKARAPI